MTGRLVCLARTTKPDRCRISADRRFVNSVAACFQYGWDSWLPGGCSSSDPPPFPEAPSARETRHAVAWAAGRSPKGFALHRSRNRRRIRVGGAADSAAAPSEIGAIATAQVVVDANTE